MNALLDRRGLLCDQPAPPQLTGIDFVQVVDPGDQRELRVFFVIDPTEVVTGPGPATMVAAGALPLAFGGAVTVTAVGGGQTIASMAPVLKEWRQVSLGGANRTVLFLRFAQPGDFANYRLRIDHPAIDPFFNDVLFSFKQGCDTGFDCAPACDCPEDSPRDVEIDYLARDFDSFAAALGDFAARYYPEWGERITADQGVMLQEIMAALGDEFSYIQDRYAREMYLETATQRRSLLRLAGLVDYVPDPGSNASVLLSLDLTAQGLSTPALTFAFADRLPFWAVPEGRAPIAFELGESLADEGKLLAHASWNQLALHMVDPGSPCLEVGATECLIRPTPGNARLPLAAQIPAGFTAGAQAWVGRRMILWSRPADPGVPVRAWPVTIKAVDQTWSDPLQPFAPGQPLRLTRLCWGEDEALPFALRISETVLLGNVAPASAGRTTGERFRVGAPDFAKAPAFRDYPRAVERQGPAGGECCSTTIGIMHGLADSEEEGVNHTGPHGYNVDRIADIALRELDPADPDNAPGTAWLWHSSLIEAGVDERVFTLDPGMVRPVVHYHRNGEIIEHADYAGDAGWTLRFGSGEFGRTPEDGTAFEVAYRTLLGRRSNVAAHTIRVIDPPDGSPRKAALATVLRVRNPLAATGGVDPEPVESIRETAPEAWRAFPLNAVRDEHYREIVERDLGWVQRAGATSRWTGSWLTTFVTADPRGAFAYMPEQRGALTGLVDAIRMAGHEAAVRDPVYVSLDLEVSLCIMPGHYAGEVRAAVIAALTGSAGDARGLFHPDNFTFGQSLFRSAIEAAVQAVPGVLGVTGICVRERGTRDWRRFEEPELRVPVNAVLRIDNDPVHPERGTLRVQVGDSAASPAGCACCAS